MITEHFDVSQKRFIGLVGESNLGVIDDPLENVLQTDPEERPTGMIKIAGAAGPENTNFLAKGKLYSDPTPGVALKIYDPITSVLKTTGDITKYGDYGLWFDVNWKAQARYQNTKATNYTKNNLGTGIIIHLPNINPIWGGSLEWGIGGTATSTDQQGVSYSLNPGPGYYNKFGALGKEGVVPGTKGANNVVWVERAHTMGTLFIPHGAGIFISVYRNVDREIAKLQPPMDLQSTMEVLFVEEDEEHGGEPRIVSKGLVTVFRFEAVGR